LLLWLFLLWPLGREATVVARAAMSSPHADAELDFSYLFDYGEVVEHSKPEGG